MKIGTQFQKNVSYLFQTRLNHYFQNVSFTATITFVCRKKRRETLALRVAEPEKKWENGIRSFQTSTKKFRNNSIAKIVIKLLHVLVKKLWLEKKVLCKNVGFFLAQKFGWETCCQWRHLSWNVRLAWRQQCLNATGNWSCDCLLFEFFFSIKFNRVGTPLPIDNMAIVFSI